MCFSPNWQQASVREPVRYNIADFFRKWGIILPLNPWKKWGVPHNLNGSFPRKNLPKGAKNGIMERVFHNMTVKKERHSKIFYKHLFSPEFK